LVELKAARVVTLDASTASEALTLAEEAAFRGRHPSDKVRSLIAPGYPKRAEESLPKPRVDVPD
jgi:hypothetical protein